MPGFGPWAVHLDLKLRSNFHRVIIYSKKSTCAAPYFPPRPSALGLDNENDIYAAIHALHTISGEYKRDESHYTL